MHTCSMWVLCCSSLAARYTLPNTSILTFLVHVNVLDVEQVLPEYCRSLPLTLRSIACIPQHHCNFWAACHLSWHSCKRRWRTCRCCIACLTRLQTQGLTLSEVAPCTITLWPLVMDFVFMPEPLCAFFLILSLELGPTPISDGNSNIGSLWCSCRMQSACLDELYQLFLGLGFEMPASYGEFCLDTKPLCCTASMSKETWSKQA